MAERYKRVYSLDKDLYAEGSPVLIKAGALLLDNKNNSILAQMKFQNIGIKKIKGLTVGIIPLDVAGEVNGEEVEYHYLDMLADRDELFGSQKSVPLSDNATRGIRVRVKDVVYEDNQREILGDEEWDPLLEQDTLYNVFGDRYTVKQFQAQYNASFEYVPITHKNIWICGCKAINRNTEDKCHLCQFRLDDYLTLNTHELKRKGEEARINDERIKQEQAEEARRLQEEEEKRRIETEKEEKKRNELLRKRNKKIFAMVACIALLTVTVYGSYRFLPPFLTQKKAEKAFDLGDYDKAAGLYEKLNTEGQFSDIIDECNYRKGLELLENEDYMKAREAFKNANGYEDSKKLKKECEFLSLYKRGIEELNNKDYSKAVFYLSKVPNSYIDLTENDKETLYKLANEELEKESFKNAIDYFQLIGDYKDTKEILETVRNYSYAIDYLEKGRLDKAKECLSKIDNDYKDTSKMLSVIDQYSKYEGKWICEWIEHSYGREDGNDKDYLEITVKIYDKSDIKPVVYEYNGGSYYERYGNSGGSIMGLTHSYVSLEGNKIVWKDNYNDYYNILDVSTGERIETMYEDDGSVFSTTIYKYRSE